MARRRKPLLLVSLAILFLGAGTAATLLLRPGGPLAGSSAGTGDPGPLTVLVPPAGMAAPESLRPATLTVRVLREPGGAPVPGARVTVSQARATGLTVADAQGWAVVKGLVEGKAAVRAEADGLDGPAALTALRPGDNGPMQVRLSAAVAVAETGSLRVKWTGPDAGGNWTARVVRIPRSPGSDGSKSTRGRPPDGFGFGPLPPGRYEVTLSCPAGTGEAEVEVLPGVTTEVEIGPLLPGDPREGPVLAGEVVDGAGVPVAGASLMVLTAGPQGFRREFLAMISSFTTDAAGRFRIRVAEPGPFWIRANARGFAAGAAGPFTPSVEGIRVLLDVTGAVEGRLLSPPGTGASAILRLGIHFDPEPGAAAAAVVWEPEHRVTTGFRDGRFLLKDLPPGRGSLFGSVDGRPFGPVDVTIRAGEVADIGTIEVAAPRSIRGRVKDGTGAPLAGVYVQVEGEFSGLPAAISAPDGSFLLEGVSAGEVRLSVLPSPAREAPGGGPGLRRPTMVSERVKFCVVVTTVIVPAGGDCEIADIVLPGPGEVQGHAFDAAGRPAMAARVLTSGGDGVFTDSRGAFSLRIAAGEHELRLLFPGSTAPAAVATVVVPEGGSVTVDLRAER